MPFSDPMADGPAIQAASLRALKSGMTLAKTLEVRAPLPQSATRATPIVLMGYYNPIYRYGVPRFLDEAKAAGVDGLIVVDLPPEHDDGAVPAGAGGRDRLHPAGDADHRRQAPADGAAQRARASSTMSRSRGSPAPSRPTAGEVDQGGGAAAAAHRRCRWRWASASRTPAQAAEVSRVADAAVVGSALVETRGRASGRQGPAKPGLVERPCSDTCSALAKRRAPGARARSRGRRHELAHQFRPAQDPRRRRQEGGAGQSLAQMPGLRADAVPPRARGQSLRLRQLRPSSADFAPSSAWRCCSTMATYTIIELPKVIADPLKFRDRKRYGDRLKEAQAPRAAASRDAALVAHGTIGGVAAVVCGLRLRLHGRLDGRGGGRGGARRRRGSPCCRRRRWSWCRPRAARACRRASCR